MADYGVSPNPPYENRLNLAALLTGGEGLGVVQLKTLQP
jgi:hypothetical protein